ncbi:MAG: globin [Kordia sp.]|nr:MAG: globin [Kordia sp.]
MNDIQNRKDVALLVHTFYSKVRANDKLGPIFNKAITDWEHHLEHLTDFWESQLFRKNTYEGNPLKMHVAIDKANNNQITNDLFGLWLQFWIQTLDELFKGEKVDLAKNRARNIAGFLFMEIFKARS